MLSYKLLFFYYLYKKKDKGPKNYVLSCQRELAHTAHMPSNDFSTAKASIDRYRDMELKQKQRQEVMERIVDKIESSWKLIEQFTALQISSVAKSSIETISGELNTLQNELFTFDKKTNHDAIESDFFSIFSNNPMSLTFPEPETKFSQFLRRDRTSSKPLRSQSSLASFQGFGLSFT